MNETDRIWRQTGHIYSPSSTANQMDELPGGIYKIGASPMGWYLERQGDEFKFPFKIYGTHDRIIRRISACWEDLEGNLGVLLNGLKGTGKTVTAHLTCNWCAQQGIPVIIIDRPISFLTDVLKGIPQDIVLFFDEFEKTHDREAQQALLSTLDGNARTSHRRLFMFTTNNPELNENMLDRPSRIRYTFNFEGLEPEVIMAIINDLLDPELGEYVDNILDYVSTRKVRSIDVVKATIKEVNQFREAPQDFEDIFNLSRLQPHYFKVSLVTPQGDQVIIPEFRPRYMKEAMTHIGTKAAWKVFNEAFTTHQESFDCNSAGTHRLILQEAVNEPYTYKAKVRVHLRDTDCAGALGLPSERSYSAVWLDNKPEGWVRPNFVGKDNEVDAEAIDEYFANDSAYGTKDTVITIRVEPEYNAPDWVRGGMSDYERMRAY